MLLSLSIRLDVQERGYNHFKEFYIEVNEIMLNKNPDMISLFFSQTGTGALTAGFKMVFSLMITASAKTMQIAEVLNSMVDFSKRSGLESLEKSIVFLRNEQLLQLDFLSAIFTLNQNRHSKEELTYLIKFSLNVLRKRFRNTRPRILTKSLYLLSKVARPPNPRSPTWTPRRCSGSSETRAWTCSSGFRFGS